MDQQLPHLPSPRARQRLSVVLWSVAALLMAVFLVAIILPAAHPPRSSAPRIKCQANLKQIGLALQMYANDHNGQLPVSLVEVLETQDIPPEVFVCPAAPDWAAEGATTRATLADFAKPGHCSYVYLGAGQKWKNDSKRILAFELLSNHHDGLNVLFGDGHPEFFLKGQVPPWISAVVDAPPRGRR